MGTRSNSIVAPGSQGEATLTDKLRKQVLHELENILNSQAFRTSERSKEFLSFVVQRTLDGRTNSLKERVIGSELFHRPSSYATGDDPVVRNKASEVRRRLAQYYHEESEGSQVRIELPVGSYVPQIHWNSEAAPTKPDLPRRAKGHRKLWLVATGLSLALIAAVIGVEDHFGRPSDAVVEKFWAPVFNTTRPVLICLAKPVLYRPSLELYRGYAKTHPGMFQTEVERMNSPLPLDPKEKVGWGDIVPYWEFGVAMGDVEVAAQVSALLGRMNKASEVRIGNNYSFDDLRRSPAVVIGAYSNRWTMQMTANLRFVFAEQDERLWIQDRSASGKTWASLLTPRGEITEDFGVVTRLLDSKTGQLLIAAAGIRAAGSQAAGEVICRQDYLAEALRAAPHGWQKKNLEMVVQTNVIDSVAGPPRVVATYFW